MSRESEEVEFLRDQVQRLSTSLSNYQKKHSVPSITISDAALYNSNSAHQPSLTDKRYLSPLLAEYDAAMAELNQQIAMYQAELDAMSQRVEQVTEENARLHLELRKNLEAQIHAATQSGAVGSKLSGRADVGDMLKTLQQQLDMVTKDRDTYQDLLKKTSRELELVQRSDQEKAAKLLQCKAELAEAQQIAVLSRRGTEDLELNNYKMDEERIRCLKIIKAQELELEDIQDKFSQLKNTLKSATSKNEDLTNQLEEITYQMKKRESERARAMSDEKTLDERLHILQIANTDLEGKLLASQRDAISLTGEKTVLEETLASVQARMAAMEQREQEAVTHVKESMQIAEGALLEREQASIREHQMEKQVERLRSSLSIVVREAGEKTKREINLLREECNKSIDKMGLEIHKLEQEVGERQAQLERCQREKKAVEKELEKALAQKPLELVQTGQNIHELQKRVCVAERARDDTQVKLEALQAASKRLEMTLAEERQANAQLDEEHRKWQRQTQEETSKLREEKLKALSEASHLQQQLRASEQAKEATELKLVQEVATLERRFQVKEKELTCRLQSSDESHQKSIQELRGLLNAQHRVGTKWREDSKALAETSEKTIVNLSNELSRCRLRIDELTKQLSHLKSVKEEQAKRLKDATEAKHRLQQRLKEAEGQAEGAREQVAEMVLQAKALLHERRELNRELDQVKLQMATTTSYKRHYNPPMAPSATTPLVVHPKAAPTPQPTVSRPHHHHSSYVSSQFLPANSSVPPIHPQPHLHPASAHDPTQWNQNLSQLHKSLKQVREEFGLDGGGGRHGEGDENTSQCSALSMSDLSHAEHPVS